MRKPGHWDTKQDKIILQMLARDGRLCSLIKCFILSSMQIDLKIEFEISITLWTWYTIRVQETYIFLPISNPLNQSHRHDTNICVLSLKAKDSYIPLVERMFHYKNVIPCKTDGQWCRGCTERWKSILAESQYEKKKLYTLECHQAVTIFCVSMRLRE